MMIWIPEAIGHNNMWQVLVAQQRMQSIATILIIVLLIVAAYGMIWLACKMPKDEYTNDVSFVAIVLKTIAVLWIIMALLLIATEGLSIWNGFANPEYEAFRELLHIGDTNVIFVFQ